MAEKKKRIEWIDIAKFIGMFAIYLGHVGEGTGKLTVLVFQFHVPLFFFLSGCMSNYDRESGFWSYAKKRAIRIMVPFYVFALVSLVIHTIVNNLCLYDILQPLALIVVGCIRNTYFAPGLWFLSCLFVMEIVFWFLKKLKYKPLMLAVSFVFFLIAELVIEPRPIVTPHLPYNVDSMFYYMLFFVIGYCVYPYLSRFMQLETQKKKLAFLVILVVTGIYFVLVYDGRSIAHKIPVYGLAVFTLEVIQPLIIVAFMLCLSKLLSGVRLLARFGQESLFLCGNEWFGKTLIGTVTSMIGLSIVISNPLTACLYALAAMALNLFLIIPAEKRIVVACKNMWNRETKEDSVAICDSSNRLNKEEHNE